MHLLALPVVAPRHLACQQHSLRAPVSASDGPHPAPVLKGRTCARGCAAWTALQVVATKMARGGEWAHALHTPTAEQALPLEQQEQQQEHQHQHPLARAGLAAALQTEASAPERVAADTLDAAGGCVDEQHGGARLVGPVGKESTAAICPSGRAVRCAEGSSPKRARLEGPSTQGPDLRGAEGEGEVAAERAEERLPADCAGCVGAKQAVSPVAATSAAVVAHTVAAARPRQQQRTLQECWRAGRCPA